MLVYILKWRVIVKKIEEDLVQELDEFLKNMDTALSTDDPFETYQELIINNKAKEKVK